MRSNLPAALLVIDLDQRALTPWRYLLQTLGEGERTATSSTQRSATGQDKWSRQMKANSGANTHEK
jgi:hypothetical protein